jgi:hypothetical protein
MVLYKESSRVRGCLLLRHKPLRVVESIVREEENIYYSSSLSLSLSNEVQGHALRSSGKYLRPRSIVLSASAVYNDVTDDPGSNPNQKYARRRNR